MIDYSIVESKKVIVRLMESGVEITDNNIEEIAEGLYDSTDKDFDKNKKDFVTEIHRILGR